MASAPPAPAAAATAAPAAATTAAALGASAASALPLARAPARGAKAITVIETREDGSRRVWPYSVASELQFERLLRLHDYAKLVRSDDDNNGDNNAPAVLSFGELADGGVYELESERRVATRSRKQWTQFEDAGFEREATLAVRDAVAAGPLGEEQLEVSIFNNRILINRAGQRGEIDGLVVSPAVAYVIEAKRSAEPKHVELAIAKAAFVEGIARDGGASDIFAGFARGGSGARFVPVLACRSFPPFAVELCHSRGVGVVIPNGRGHSIAPPALLLGVGAARRALHGLARLACGARR